MYVRGALVRRDMQQMRDYMAEHLNVATQIEQTRTQCIDAIVSGMLDGISALNKRTAPSVTIEAVPGSWMDYLKDEVSVDAATSFLAEHAYAQSIGLRTELKELKEGLINSAGFSESSFRVLPVVLTPPDFLAASEGLVARLTEGFGTELSNEGVNKAFKEVLPSPEGFMGFWQNMYESACQTLQSFHTIAEDARKRHSNPVFRGMTAHNVLMLNQATFVDTVYNMLYRPAKVEECERIYGTN
jgi:hypothetical protein